MRKCSKVSLVFNDERMVWLSFGALAVILDAATNVSTVTTGFDSGDRHADYSSVISRGAESIEAPQDKPWGARTDHLKGPGGLTVEIDELLSRN